VVGRLITLARIHRTEPPDHLTGPRSGPGDPPLAVIESPAGGNPAE